MEAGAGVHLALPLVACRPGRVTWQGFVVVSPPLTWRESSLSPLLPCACVHTCVQACVLCVCLVWSHPGRRGERALGFCGGVFPDGRPGAGEGSGVGVLWLCPWSGHFSGAPPGVGWRRCTGVLPPGPPPSGCCPCGRWGGRTLLRGSCTPRSEPFPRGTRGTV